MPDAPLTDREFVEGWKLRLCGTQWINKFGTKFLIESIDGSNRAWYWLALGSRPQFRSIAAGRLIREYKCISPATDGENTVYRLEPKDSGFCFECHRGTDLLAGAGHSPLNAEANYVCRAHLDPDAIIRDMRKTREDIAAGIQPEDLSYRLVPLTQGQSAKVDTCDFGFIMQWKWRARFDKTTGKYYAVRRAGSRASPIDITMARLLKDAPADKQVDHHNLDTLDNRRFNLRVANAVQNQANKPVQKNNRAGFKGVRKSGSGWRATIRVQGKQVHLGTFSSPELAHNAYVSKAQEVYGEFARG